MPKKEQERVAAEQQKALQEQRWEEEVEHKKQEAQKEREAEAKKIQQQKDLQEQAQFLYTGAVTLFDQKNWTKALAQFESIDQMVPDYKNTRHYLSEISNYIGSEAAAKVKPAYIAPVAVAVSTPEQDQVSTKAQEKAGISMEDQQKQASEISALADKSMELYRQIADISDGRSIEQTKRKMAQVRDILNSLKENKERILRQMREEESKSEQEERRAKAEGVYQKGVQYFRSRDYADAKTEFLDLENIIPDYRSTRRYLRRIEKEQGQAGVEVVTNYQKNQADHLKQLQNNETTEEARRAQQEQEKQRSVEQQQQEAVQQLAQKASDINDDIIGLSRSQDYEAMQAKFKELENTITALKTLKYQMMTQKERQKHDQQLARESLRTREEIYKAGNQGDLKENRPKLSNQFSDVEQYRHREITKEQNSLFSEGVELYKQKQYTQAKLLFTELAQQFDPRADAWLKKVDRGIARDILRTQEAAAKERTAFIAEQIKAQRQLVIIQERERQRQKQLTEELERQKHLFEDDHLLQLRKEELLKAQQIERQQQEDKRRQLEKSSEKDEEMFRFHKIPSAEPATVPAGMTPQQVQAQIDFSNKRKSFLDSKYQEDQEAKHREELLGQQNLSREEKSKQLEIIREESKRRKELERQERQVQSQLESQREVVRKQLEAGVEAMYQEAMSLYKQGNFLEAADKFKDVQDILPGYKRSSQYMDDARLKSGEKPIVMTPVATAPLSRQDSVSKALDLLDPDAK